MRVIVTGLIGQYPLGGVAWDYIQYVLGLRELGHDVYYVEDSGQWPFNPKEGGTAKDASFTARYLAALMASFGLEDRWAYCFPWEAQWFGLSDARRREVIGSADLLINVSGTLAHPDRYRSVPRMAYIDTDPAFTQVKLARGQHDFHKMVALHDSHFSFGETLSDVLPVTGFCWLPTRQPVAMDHWEPLPTDNGRFTTVMNWTSYKPLEHDGKSYGQKDLEFKKFLDLPQSQSDSLFEIAINSGKTKRTPIDLLRHKRWQVVHPDDVCPDAQSYQAYIRESRAEWSVAKHGYVVGQTGWFSCRSACYLAAGRPVVVQDTGFSRVLPTGDGIVPFVSFDDSGEGVRSVEEHYDRHRAAARDLATSYFDARVVLASLLDKAFSAPLNSQKGVA